MLIRGYGEPIKGFGGKASGPLPLIEGMESIAKIFKSRDKKKLRSIDVLDICNILGSIVVAGNIRRSAEVALGDSDDLLFLRAKNWSAGNIPNYRAMSNNTIYADNAGYLTDEFWQGYTGKSEPYGLFNLELSRTQGRLGEYIEDNCEGGNPCMEITLDSYEFCNLSELFLPNIESKGQLIDVAKLLYKTQKATTQLKHLYSQSDEIVRKNTRIGIGVGGIVESLEKLPWLDETYKALRAHDKAWSVENGYNPSIKLTTVKPSGTISLLAGVTPGIHPAFSEYYIRRVRIATNDLLLDYCKRVNYPVEYARGFDGREDKQTSIVSFPCKSKENAILAKNMSAIAQLDLVLRLQTIWSDNAVSCTVYYQANELDSIKAWLTQHYQYSLKSVSFLLHNDHGFDQAPYEEINRDEYDVLVNRLWANVSMQNVLGDTLDVECEGGICPVR